MLAQRADAVVVLVSAIASGQGKTTATAALARLLSRRGVAVRIFKIGSDFIDPAILERAVGSAVYNLDLWMVGLDASRALLAQAASEVDVVLIEGVMGLYDGVPSSADLARAFDLPVLTVLDTFAMAQTAGAVVLGLRDYGPVTMAGVVANHIASSGHASMVAAALRNIPLLASLPRQAASLPERHLGLVLPAEMEALDTLLDDLADRLQLNEAAWDALPPASFASMAEKALPPLLAGRRIAVARDAAFAFLYPANLDCLREMGASLCFFSPLANEPVPADADAIWLPGGYPELHGAALESGTVWSATLREAHAAGKPILAECGGLMAVCSQLFDKQGRTWQMAGLLPAHTRMQSQLAAIGLQCWHTKYGQLRGHAFHYSKMENAIVAHDHARKHPTGDAGEAVYRAGSLTASYFHAYFPSCPHAVAALFRGEPA